MVYTTLVYCYCIVPHNISIPRRILMYVSSLRQVRPNRTLTIVVDRYTMTLLRTKDRNTSEMIHKNSTRTLRMALEIAPSAGPLSTTSPNPMPFHIEYTGPAPISRYFRPKSAPTSDVTRNLTAQGALEPLPPPWSVFPRSSLQGKVAHKRIKSAHRESLAPQRQ